MKKLMLLCLLISIPAFSETHEGYWLFYDPKLKEKFLLNLTDPMVGYQQIFIQDGGGLGARYFKSDVYGWYRVIINRQDFRLANKIGSSIYMSGQFNLDFTELSGVFDDGSRFVAKKQNSLNAFDKPKVYQVIYNGEYAAEYCQKARDERWSTKYSLKLSCFDTGGIGGARSQVVAEKGQAANWLVKPNTFLNYEQCTEAMQKVLDKYKCSEE